MILNRKGICILPIYCFESILLHAILQLSFHVISSDVQPHKLKCPTPKARTRARKLLFLRPMTAALVKPLPVALEDEEDVVKDEGVLVVVVALPEVLVPTVELAA